MTPNTKLILCALLFVCYSAGLFLAGRRAATQPALDYRAETTTHAVTKTDDTKTLDFDVTKQIVENAQQKTVTTKYDCKSGRVSSVTTTEAASNKQTDKKATEHLAEVSATSATVDAKTSGSFKSAPAHDDNYSVGLLVPPLSYADWRSYNVTASRRIVGPVWLDVFVGGKGFAVGGSVKW